jgi:hypothetical protein
VDAEEAPLAALSRAAAASMLGRLQQLHGATGRSLDALLSATMPELQAISAAAKQESVRRLLTDAKAERAAGGVGAERRFDRALAEIDAVEHGWDDAVRGSFDRQLRDWVSSGGPVLGPGGWIRVMVRPYQQGSVWWTDPGRADQWCLTIARDVFAGIVADPRSRTGDTVALAQLSEPSIGPVIDASVVAMLGDFQDQQRGDAARYGVHPAQAQQAAERINGMRGPLLSACRAELLRLLREWDAQGRVSPSS